MPGNIKTAPSGAVFACPDGRIFSGCNPCGGGGCPYFVLPSGYNINYGLNAVAFHNGLPELSGGVPLLNNPPASDTDFVLKAFYYAYWGAASTPSTHQANCSGPNMSRTTGSTIDTIALQSTHAEAQEITTTATPLLSSSFGDISVVPVPAQFSLPAAGASQLSFRAVSTATPEDIYFHVAPAVLSSSIGISSEESEAGDCNGAVSVTVPVTRSFSGVIPGQLALTANRMVGNTDYYAYLRLVATGYEYLGNTALRITYNAVPGDQTNTFLGLFGAALVSAEAVITFDTGEYVLESVLLYIDGPVGSLMGQLPKDVELRDGIVSGTSTLAPVFWGGSSFITAALGRCPAFPPPRVRVASGKCRYTGRVTGATQHSFCPNCYVDITTDVWVSVYSYSFTFPPEGAPPGNTCCAGYAWVQPHAYPPMRGNPGSALLRAERAWYAYDFGGIRYRGQVTMAGGTAPDALDPAVVDHVARGLYAEGGHAGAFITMEATLDRVQPTPYILP